MAISTPRDNNRVPTMVAALNTDGTTPVSVAVNASNHGIKISDGTSGSDFSRTNAVRDANRVTGIMGVSNADGVTPVEIYADSSGNLLIQST